MTERHVMVPDQQGDRETLFTCPGCSRRLIFQYGGEDPSYTVLDHGDPGVLHSGSTSPLLTMDSGGLEP